MNLIRRLLPSVLGTIVAYVALILLFGYHMPWYLIPFLLLGMMALQVFLGIGTAIPAAKAVKSYNDQQEKKVQEARERAKRQFEHHDDDEPIHSL